MNIPDHISESLETTFLVKILKFFDADPDSGSVMEKILIQGRYGTEELRISLTVGTTVLHYR
jgi:hypothetical protein